MSSSFVRSTIKTWLGTQIPAEKLIDLTAEYSDIPTLLAKYSLTHTSTWLGLQFIGSTEEAIGVSSDNTKGYYREYGSMFFHVVAPANSTSASNILGRCDTIMNKLRGQRISSIVIEGIVPPNFEAPATLQFEGGFTSASLIINYYRDYFF